VTPSGSVILNQHVILKERQRPKDPRLVRPRERILRCAQADMQSQDDRCTSMADE